MRYLKFIFGLVLVLVLSFGAFYRFWFLRLPHRNIPHDNRVFVSPANGTVVSILHWNKEFLDVMKEKYGWIKVWTADVDTAGYMISIQMDLSNVHYQRAPLSAEVLNKKYVPGKFHDALSIGQSFGIRFENEHNELLMMTADSSRFKVVQIAGFLARRIVDFVHPGEQLNQGRVIGLIRFGSQVTVILPHNAHVVTEVGRKVTDGESVLAEMDQKSTGYRLAWRGGRP